MRKDRDMRSRQLFYGACGACLAASLGWFAPAALAFSGGDGHDLHGRDLQSLSPEERSLWQAGHWIRDWHDGHLAWWWQAGGSWYFYQMPSYPYPRSIAPTEIVDHPPPVPAGLSPGNFWFYCDQPAGYTPYVTSCDGTWRPVAVPPSAVAQK
jgi:hypothetical protein